MEWSSRSGFEEGLTGMMKVAKNSRRQDDDKPQRHDAIELRPAGAVKLISVGNSLTIIIIIILLTMFTVSFEGVQANANNQSRCFRLADNMVSKMTMFCPSARGFVMS